MKNAGLLSVSFRQNSIDEIIDAAKSAGLCRIEWGGDVHVPAGDTETAKTVARKCADKGITITSYGSYIRLGISSQKDFEDVCESARALSCSVIRVWAGDKNSEDFSDEEFEKLVSETRKVCDIAGEITVCLECHGNTYTNRYESALEFIKRVGKENLRMYWQPNQYESLEYNIDSCTALKDYVTNVHVFNWHGNDRFALNDGIAEWKKYVDILGDNHNYMLEFMPDGRIETLNKEAEALKEILR